MIFGPVQDANELTKFGEFLMALAEDTQREDVELLIDLATAVVGKARGMGVDTARHEVFLARAKEEFTLGNLVSAKQFTTYPLSLSEELDETGTITVLSIFLLFLAGGRIVCTTRRAGQESSESFPCA
jgi:hypothetical protein